MKTTNQTGHQPPTPEDIAGIAFISILIVLACMAIFHL